MRGRLVLLARCSPSARSPARRRRRRDARGRPPSASRDGLFDAQTELVLVRRRTRPRRDVARARAAYARRAARRRSRRADPAADAALADGARRRRRGRARRRPRRARRRPRQPPAPRSSAAPTRSRVEAAGARRRDDRPPLAAAARVPHRHPLHPPGRRRDARARPARRAARSTPQGAQPGRRARTCSTPTRRGCASCSPTPAAASSRTSRRGAPRPPPRPPATSRILAPRYAEDRGAAAEQQAQRDLRGAARPAERPRPGARRRRPARSTASPPPRSRRRRPRAAPSSCCSSSRSCPVEYGRGVKDDQGHRDFEIQEAVAFRTGAVGAFADLRDQLAKRDRAPHRRPPRRRSTELGAARRVRRPEPGRASPTHEQVEAVATTARGRARRPRCPTAWDGADRRVRLRPDRAHARPHGGRRRRRRSTARPSRRAWRPTRSSSSARSAGCAPSTRASRSTSRA